MDLTVVDAGVVIAVLESRDAHHTTALQEVRRRLGAGDHLVLPMSAYAEVLVHPSAAGSSAVETVDQLLDRLPITLQPLERRIGALAAGLRAQHGRRLPLPDALVVATAVALEATALVTTDRGWPIPTDLGLRGELVILGAHRSGRRTP